MAKKTVDFKKTGIEKIPNNKPVVYKILTESGGNNYTGIAQKGRVRERIEEHLSGGKDYVPGSKVQIEQMKSIEEARGKEARIISRSGPKYNEQGK
jgi:predicted GIY-YIG superfamily endonuclease